MATVALCLIFWVSLSHDRREARQELKTLSPESYQADYRLHWKEVESKAHSSDLYLVGITSVLAFFVLLYELTALFFGWLLGYLIDTPSTVAHPPPPPPLSPSAPVT
jgi:hypothetical protein